MRVIIKKIIPNVCNVGKMLLLISTWVGRLARNFSQLYSNFSLFFHPVKQQFIQLNIQSEPIRWHESFIRSASSAFTSLVVNWLLSFYYDFAFSIVFSQLTFSSLQNFLCDIKGFVNFDVCR